jgi:hypothetical protein
MTKGPALCAFNEAFKCKFTAVDMENVTQDRNKLNSSRVGEDGPVVVRVGAFELIAALFACPFLSGDFNLHEDVVVKTDPTEVRSDEASDAAANAAAKAEAVADPAVRAAPMGYCGRRASRSSRYPPVRLVDEVVAGGEGSNPRKRRTTRAKNTRSKRAKKDQPKPKVDENPDESEDEKIVQKVYDLSAEDGENFLETLKDAEAISLLGKVMNSKRRCDAVDVRLANAVDRSWTDLFFDFDTPRDTGQLCNEYVYLQRKMGRWLDPGGKSWFGTLQGNNRLGNEFFEIGMGSMPGGNQGFGVYAKKAFTMKDVNVKHFEDTMKFSAYVLDAALMLKENISLEEVLRITSTIANGGLKSALVEGDNDSKTSNESRVMISHGGTLATLVNNGDAYAKIEYLPKVRAGAADAHGAGKVDSQNVMVDAEFVKFLKDNPAIMKSIAKDTLIAEGSDDDVRTTEVTTRQMSFTMQKVRYVGLRVPWYFASPRIGESFVEGEQVFASYSLCDEPMSGLDPNDERFLGTKPNGGYQKPTKPNEGAC